VSTKSNPIIIEQKSKWQLLNCRELIQYKDLLYFFVLRDVTVLYKQTVLGLGWAILRPVMNMIAFSLIFGKLAKIPSNGVPYPIFSYSALVPWTYFSTAFTRSAESLIQNQDMLTKIYFPRIFMPLTPVLSGLFDFVLSFLILIVMMFFYKITPTLSILYLPFLVLLMVLATSGMGLWLSALGIYYRDVRYAARFLSQLLMYLAPVVYPISLIPGKYRYIAALNPMVGVIEGFRSALLGKNPMPWDLIGVGTLCAFMILISGMFLFRRMERIFADVA
jgi:lipopolysaccharide transport system permease protein